MSYNLKMSCYDIIDNKVYDTHTLCIDPEEYEVDEVIDMLGESLQRLKSEFNIKIKTKIKVKYDKDKEPIIYLRVSNKAAYNILIGLNKDGSERVIEYEDPDFIAPEEPFEECLNKSLNIANTTEWWLLGEIEDEVKSKYSPKLLRKELPPLIELIQSEDEDDKIIVERAFIEYEVDKFKHNVIWANVPDWINEKILRGLFYEFVTYPYKKCKNGKLYPLISIKTNKYGRSAYVAFDDRSYDAEFSMFINEYINIKNPVSNKYEEVQFKFFGTY